MDIFTGLLNGFVIALSGTNILFCFLGAVIGTAIGVLPGLGPAATIALLLPMTYIIGRDGKVVDAWYGYDKARTQKALKKLGL